MRRPVPLLACVLLQACAFSATDEDRGYVVMDEEARRAGLAIERGGVSRTMVRPSAITAGDEAFLLDAEGRAVPLDVAPGEVVLIRGARGHVDRWPLGTARPDVLIARVTAEEGATSLAATIDADALARDDRTVELVGPRVWENAAALAEDPALVTELLPAVGDAAVVPPPDEASASFPEPRGAIEMAAAVLPVPGDGASPLDAIVSADAVLAQAAAASAAAGDPLAGAPPGLAFTAASPGRYAVAIQSHWSGGCSRSWSTGTTSAAIVLDLAPDGSATACRSRISHSTTTSMSFDGGPGRGSRTAFSHDESQQQGYRGRWQRQGAAMVLAFTADDSVCTRVVQGVSRPAPTWTMTCAAATSRGEPPLPGRGLACTFGSSMPWDDQRAYALSALGAEQPWTVLGPDRGWRVTSEAMRWSAGELTIEPSTQRVTPLLYPAPPAAALP